MKKIIPALLGLFVYVAISQAAPLDPASPEVTAITSRPLGAVDLKLSWTKNNANDEASAGFGYMVYYGDAETNIARIAAMGAFPEAGTLREYLMPDAVCTLELERLPQTVWFNIVAYNDTGISRHSDPISIALSANDVAGVCTPKKPAVTIVP